MKNFVLVITLLCSSSILLHAQTILTPQPLNRQYYGGDSVSFDDTTVWAPRQQQKFMFGWQWQGPNATTNTRLHCNFYQDHFGYNSSRSLRMSLIPDSGDVKYVVWQHLSWLPSMGNFLHLLDGIMGMHYDPTAKQSVDEAVPLRTGDTTGAAFGFGYRNDTLGYVPPSGADFDRYILDTIFTNPALQATGVTVLSNPVMDDQYKQSADTFFPILFNNPADSLQYANRFITYHNDSVKYVNESRKNGRWWMFSINLRRADISDTSTSNSDTLLSIRLPYYLRFQPDSIANNIIFDSLPVANQNQSVSLPLGRGKVLPMQRDTNGVKVLYITRKMLPPGNAAERDMTINTYFRFQTASADTLRMPLPPNPWLQGGRGANAADIVKLGITVRYHGRGAIAIDWLRIGTPELETIVRGYKDSLLWELTRHNINIMRDTIAAGRNMRLFAFYGQDEVGYNGLWCERYYNYLFDHRLTTEGPTVFKNAVIDSKLPWQGGVYLPLNAAVSPYTPYAYPYENNTAYNYKYNMGLYGGWQHGSRYGISANYDSLTGSTYETLLYNSTPDYGFKHLKLSSADAADSLYVLNYYPQCLSYGVSNTGPLICIEDNAYFYYHTQQAMLYGDVPWWTNLPVLVNWGFRGDSLYVNRRAWLFPRPLTGEEFRVGLFGTLVLGGKGIMVDRFYSKQRNLVDTTQPAFYDSFITGAMAGNISDTVSADSIFSTDIAGGDFLGEPDSTHLDRWIVMDSTAKYLGVRRDRIYLGRLSQRREFMKVGDFIHANDSTLMQMKLVSWLGKGIKSLLSGDTVRLGKVIHLEPGAIKTRPLHRAENEHYDSTFVDVTLHKLGNHSLDSTFILAVLNRRTSPFVWLPDSDPLALNRPDTLHHWSHPGKVLTFLTTSEFDNYVQLGKLDAYAQMGSREVTIPFNYTDTLGRYALLRIREIGGGLDTVIGQDRSIIAKFLPGQGRFYKVEILRSNEVSGDLAHSNQTKIVSHNLMRRENGMGKWVEGDSLVYYMTYHKPAPLVPMLPPRTAVYFRKSKPTSRWDNNAALQWESEYRLTDMVYHSGRWNIGDSCAYPSIVVRFDSTSEEYRAYIVYGCIKHDTTNNPLYEWQFITESIVRINNDTAIDTILPGRVLDSVKSLNMSEWGTPMINASDTANFYCYADKSRGIIASWRRPGVLIDTLRKLVSTTRISWGDTAFCTVTAQHPSMNPYSPYIRGEHHSDCALVWQESDNCTMLRSQIHYTRLFITDSQISYDLSPTLYFLPFFVNSDSSIWCVSCDSLPPSPYFTHKFPVLYRNLFYPDTDTTICDWEAVFPGHTRQDQRLDNIAWESEYTYISPPVPSHSEYINRRTIVSIDDFSSGFVPDSAFSLSLTETIWSGGTYDHLWGPTLSAGEAEYGAISLPYRGCANYSTRGVSLDFNYISMLQTIGQPPWSTIYHTTLPTLVVLAAVEVSTIATGTTPYMAHLSARGSVYLNDWQRGRHIYNSDTLIPPTIRTSGREFYKRANDNPTAETLYGFGHSDSRFVIGALQFNGKSYPLQPMRPVEPSLLPVPPDTLVTEWFRVGQSESVGLISAGDAPEKMEVWLERRNDGSRWLVQMGAGEERQLSRLDIRLENGYDEEYRLEVLNATGSTFRRETVLNADADGMERGTAADEWFIDLAATDAAQTLSIFPNPASEIVHIAVRGEEGAEVVILDAFGRTMQATAMKSGGVLTIETANYAAGVYAVHVRRSGLPDVGGRFAVVR